MSNTLDKEKLDQLNEQITEKKTAAQSKWEAFEQGREQFAKAGNDANRTDSDEFKKMDDLHKEFTSLSQELKELEGVRDGFFRMLGEDAPAKPGTPVEPQSQGKGGGVTDLASRAIESDEYKQLVASGVLDGDNRGKFNAKLAQMDRDEFKTLLTGVSDTSGGAFVQNDIKPYVPQPRRMTRILDLVTTGSTNSDTVEYVRQSAFTNVAAETAEATATTTGTKPEATIEFAKVTEAVKNIAHWVPATRRALADVAQLRTLVESQLRYGLEYRLESQIVAGNGSGENLTGIINTSNILSQPKGSDTVADAIHKAITQIRLGFIEPNGVAMHPNDWEILRLSRDLGGGTDGTGAYLYGPPALAGQETIWGLPVAVSAAVTDDTTLVGDWTQAVLWLREGAQIYVSDSHDDFFIKNLVVLLAEMRAAFGVLLPQAFAKVTSVD